MAITNAQQAKQIMNEGGPMRKIKGQDHMLAYITPSEKDILVELGGQETMTPEGILAYPPEGNYGSEAKGPGSGPGPSGITGMASTGGANFSSGNNVGNVGSSTGPKGTGKVSNPPTKIGGVRRGIGGRGCRGYGCRGHCSIGGGGVSCRRCCFRLGLGACSHPSVA